MLLVGLSTCIPPPATTCVKSALPENNLGSAVGLPWAIFPIQTPTTVVKTDQCIEVFHYRALNTER